LNLQSPKAGGLQPLRLADAQPTHVDRMAQAGVEPAVTKVRAPPRSGGRGRFAGLRTAP